MTGNYRLITVQELEILWDLSQQGSLRSLGRAKGLQASHVSKILSRIEKKLGTSVVQRSPKGIVLTPDGLRLVAVAQMVVESARQLSIDDTPVKKKVPTKLMGIAGAKFICKDLVAPVLGIIAKRNLAFRFRLLDMSPDEIEPAAFKSTVEIALFVGKASLSKAWDIKKVGDLTWGLFAGVSHPLPSTARAAEVLQYPFITPNYWNGKAFETGNDHCPVHWNQRTRGDETSSISSAIELAVPSPLQLVFAPRLATKAYVERGELREILVPEWPRVTKPVHIAFRADRVPQRLAADMVLELKKRMG